MELVVLLIIVVGIIGWWMWKEGKHEETGHPLESITKKLDVNHDGKIDTKDAVAAVEVVKEEAKVVVEKTKKAAKKTKAKAEEVVKKAKAPRKPKAK